MRHLTTLLFTPNDGGLTVMCLLGLGAGVYLFFHGFRLLQRRRLILDTPQSKIRSASMGLVELSGLAVGPYTMSAPITAKPCYYYQTIVWEWKREGKNSKWVKVAGEAMHVPFFLDDNTGKVLIDPRGAELDLHRDFEQEFCDSFFSIKDGAPDNVHAFLSRHGIVTSNKIKVQECCIKPKNALFILGTLGENHASAAGPQPIRDETFTGGTNPFQFSIGGANLVSMFAGSADAEELAGRVNLDRVNMSSTTTIAVSHQTETIRLTTDATATPKSTDMTQQQRIAAALMKAGISNPAAWAVAGAGAIPSSSAGAPGSPAVATAASGTEFDPHPPVVLMKGTNDKNFLISWRSQQAIARTLGWKCTLMIWGGPVLALFCLYMLVSVEKLFRL